MRIPALLLALCASVLVAVGCARDEEPARQAVASAETALNEVRAEAAQFAPEQLQTAEGKLAELKADLAKEEYKEVLAEVEDLQFAR